MADFDEDTNPALFSIYLVEIVGERDQKFADLLGIAPVDVKHRVGALYRAAVDTNEAGRPGKNPPISTSNK